MKMSLLKEGVPITSIVAVSGQKFFYAGRLMAASILQGGPNPVFLAEWCYKVISSRRLPSPEDFIVPDSFLQEKEMVKVRS